MLAGLAELQPDSAEAQVRLGAGLLMQGENGAAIEHIETALELDPEFQQADILLVFNHLRKKEYDAAIEAAKAYATRNPVSVTPYNLMGRVYLEAGEADIARNAFTDALKVDKGRFWSQSQPRAAGPGGWRSRDRARALPGNPRPNPEAAAAAMLEMAKLEARAGNEAAMVNWMEKAVEAQPEALEPRVVLARYNLNKGRQEQVACCSPPSIRQQKNHRRSFA